MGLTFAWDPIDTVRLRAKSRKSGRKEVRPVALCPTCTAGGRTLRIYPDARGLRPRYRLDKTRGAIWLRRRFHGTAARQQSQWPFQLVRARRCPARTPLLAGVNTEVQKIIEDALRTAGLMC